MFRRAAAQRVRLLQNLSPATGDCQRRFDGLLTGGTVGGCHRLVCRSTNWPAYLVIAGTITPFYLQLFTLV